MHAESKERKYLREGELAERWRVDVKTLQRWRYVGKGPAFVKLTGRVIYPIEVIEEYELQHLRRPMSEPL